MPLDQADEFVAALQTNNVNSAEALRHLDETAWSEYGATEQLKVVCLALMAHIEVPSTLPPVAGA